MPDQRSDAPVSRLPVVHDDVAPPLAAEVFAATAARVGTVPLLYRVLANSPELLRAWVDLAWPLREVGHAPRALRELVIMRTAQLTSGQYEWAHHWKLALAVGVREQQLVELTHWRESDQFAEQERVALAVTDELVESGTVAHGTFGALREHFDDAAIVQLALTASFYIAVGRMAATLGLQLEPGYESVPTVGRPLRVSLIVGSTRPAREVEPVADWVRAACHGDVRFELTVHDLREWDLPMFSESVDSIGDLAAPAFASPVVQAWNDVLGAADAYVIVTPEYNRSIPAVLKNALDSVFLTFAFRNKPVGLVGYSTSYTAGARAVEHLALVARDLELVALRSSVLVPEVRAAFGDDGSMLDERCRRALDIMLDDLAWWGELLRLGRARQLPPALFRRSTSSGEGR